MANTIKLKKYSDVIEELVAAEAITPGMLVEIDSNGEVRPHQAGGENALPMFALEDELQGNGINDEYSADDPVQVWIPYRGDQVNAILADEENVAIGDFLESNGDGYLRKHEAGTADVVEYPLAIVGVALEALDLSGSSGEEESGALGYHKRLKIRVA